MGGQSSKETRNETHSSSRGRHGIHVENVTIISQHDDKFAIPCKLWTPTSCRRPRAVVLLIHGGVFSKGDCDSHENVTHALVTQLNWAVLTCSFRDGATATYASGKWLADLKACVQWLLRNNNNNNDVPMGLVGASSGGWFAMAVANQMDLYDQIDFCILLCPVAHPQARAVYLQHCCQGTTPLATGKELYTVRHTPEKAMQLLQQQMKFFESYKQMAFAAERVAHNLHNVPTLMILGAVDANVPLSVTQGAMQEWASKTVIIGQACHDIQMVPPAIGSYDCYMPDVQRFFQAVVDDDEHDKDAFLPCLLPWCR